MKLHARILLHLSLTLVPLAVAAAQTPVRPYEPAPAYNTFNLSTQLTGAVNEGRDLLLAWGWMRTAGPGGALMPRLELGGGATTGRELLDRLLLTPQISVAYAFPGQHTSLGRTTRGEPYLVAGAGAYGIADFTADTRLGVAPSVSAGLGMRLFGDEWNMEMGTLEVVVERRFGFDAATELFLRFGRARPRTFSAPDEPIPGGSLSPSRRR
jgi:hypothetical protein